MFNITLKSLNKVFVNLVSFFYCEALTDESQLVNAAYLKE